VAKLESFWKCSFDMEIDTTGWVYFTGGLKQEETNMVRVYCECPVKMGNEEGMLHIDRVISEVEYNLIIASEGFTYQEVAFKLATQPVIDFGDGIEIMLKPVGLSYSEALRMEQAPASFIELDESDDE